MSNNAYLLATKYQGKINTALYEKGEELRLGQDLASFLLASLNISKVKITDLNGVSKLIRTTTVERVLSDGQTRNEVIKTEKQTRRLTSGKDFISLGDADDVMDLTALMEVINALIEIGDLSFLPEHLAEKGWAYKDMPQIALAELDDYYYCIDRVSTNDAVMTSLNLIDKEVEAAKGDGSPNDLQSIIKQAKDTNSLTGYKWLSEDRKTAKITREWNENGNMILSDGVENPEYVEHSLLLSPEFLNAFEESLDKRFSVILTKESKFFGDGGLGAVFFDSKRSEKEELDAAKSKLAIEDIVNSENLKSKILTLDKNSQSLKVLYEASNAYFFWNVWELTLNVNHISPTNTKNLFNAVVLDVKEPNKTAFYTGQVQTGALLFNFSITGTLQTGSKFDLGNGRKKQTLDIAVCKNPDNKASHVLLIGVLSEDGTDIEAARVIMSQNLPVLISYLAETLSKSIIEVSHQSALADIQNILNAVSERNGAKATPEALAYLLQS